MPELHPDTAVVLHDAGAASHALAWIDAGLISSTRVYAEGPAASLWLQKERPPLQPSLDSAMNGAKALVSGTGWQSSLEHHARTTALAMAIPSHAILDHWTNYKERFERDGATILPSTLWVTDKDAVAIAQLQLPSLPVHLLPNLYLETQIAAIRTAETRSAPHGVLAIMEPARSNWGRSVPGEFQALDYLLLNWHHSGIGAGQPLRLRLHPSENPGKYDEWIAANRGCELGIDEHVDLAAAIGNAAVIVGMNSYALTVALAAGRRVVSILPPWAPHCVLPHAGIERLRSVAETRT